jgi:acylphosphatase
MRDARQFIITGRVQGVGFRFFVRDAAGREGLHGWVRNRGDGRVEINVEGETESLGRFEQSIRHGPPGARVEDVEVSDLVPTGRETGFDIRG